MRDYDALVEYIKTHPYCRAGEIIKVFTMSASTLWTYVRRQGHDIFYDFRQSIVAGMSAPDSLSESEDMEICVVIGDLHRPFHDQKAVDLALLFMDYIKPQMIILNGDGSDFWEISRFSKDPRLGASLKQEINEMRELLSKLSLLADEVIYIEGNHERRYQRYIQDHAQSLIGLDGLSLPEQFHMKEMNIKWIPSRGKDAFIQYGNMLVGHFDRAVAKAGYTVTGLIANRGMGLVQAHNHRLAKVHKRWIDRELIGVEGGCLCSLDPPHFNNPDWQHGFTILYRNMETDVVCAEIVKIDNDYSFVWGGRRFSL